MTGTRIRQHNYFAAPAQAALGTKTAAHPVQATAVSLSLSSPTLIVNSDYAMQPNQTYQIRRPECMIS